MGTTRQSGQERRARRWRAALGASAFGLSLTIATGCASTSNTTAQQSYDPLLGQKTPPGTIVVPNNAPPATASVGPLPPATINPGGVPAIPTSSTSANTATMAGSNTQSLLGQPFPLSDNNARPPVIPGQTTTSNAQPAPPAAVPNSIPQAQAVPDAVPSPPPAVAPIANWQSPQNSQPVVQTANVAAPAPDYIKQLQDRGVRTQKIEQVPDGIRLTCYASRGTAGDIRILDVTRKDFATAAQEMLRELDQQR